MAGIASREIAAAREKAAAMPSPITAARRGITVGRYLGLSEHHAAMMVMSAASAAMASATEDGARDVTWLLHIHAEAKRVYTRTQPADADRA